MFNGWPEGEAASYLWKSILEEKGYSVELEYADAGPVFAGVSTGDYDLALDGWLPTTHAVYMDKYGDEITDLGAWNDDAKLTVAVNEDAPIDSLDELADNADLFDNRIVGIEPGAGLTAAVADEVIPTYGLDDMDFVTSSTPAMLAELKSATDSGENIAVTLWRPQWAYDAYPIRDLEDPKGTLGAAESIHSLASTTFEADYPTLAGWIKGFAAAVRAALLARERHVQRRRHRRRLHADRRRVDRREPGLRGRPDRVSSVTARHERRGTREIACPVFVPSRRRSSDAHQSHGV